MSVTRSILRKVVTAVLALSFIASVAVGVLALRQNNLRMLELREAVFIADKNDGDTSTALSELQAYVVTHMNTTLPKLGDEKAIQLKYTYERRLAADEVRVSAERADVSAQATAYCQSTHAGASFAVRSQCVEDFYAAHPVSSLTIPKELYAYEFVSPFWVPDKAGLALLAATALLLVLLLRLTSWLVFRQSMSTQ